MSGTPTCPDDRSHPGPYPQRRLSLPLTGRYLPVSLDVPSPLSALLSSLDPTGTEPPTPPRPSE